MPKIISWNVMMRCYEEKYHPKSKILQTYPKEECRVAGIITLLQAKADDETVICLQEYSSVILDKLTK